MPERYPTLEEFWRRLDEREVEPDLREALHERAQGQRTPAGRASDPALLEAVASLILPGAVPPAALAGFLDARFDDQLGRGDERQGAMARDELIPAGFAALEAAGRLRHEGGFLALARDAQEALLADAEAGELPGPERFDSALWFSRVRDLLLLAYGSDPRGMVEMGYPGPSFRPGHVWLDLEEVQGRAARRPGYLEL